MEISFRWLLFTLFFMAACSYKAKHLNSHRIPASESIERFPMPERNLEILQDHGFSGLSFEQKDSEGDFIFWTNSDRGPSPEGFTDTNTGLLSRVFIYPHFQPRITRFKFNPSDSLIHFLQTVFLSLPDGTPLSGLPNFLPTKVRVGDEVAFSLDGSSLPLDPMGIDPEGICKVKDGFWMVEEYGPSILKFNPQGRLLHRFVPQGYYPKSELRKLNRRFGHGFIREILPAMFLQRQMNRGFEAIACDDKKLYVGMQSPIKSGTLNVPIIEFDVRKKKVSRLLTYQLDSLKADKLGDFTLHNGKLLVVEQNGKLGEQAIKKIYAVQILGVESLNILKKTLVIDLAKDNSDIEKFEGLTKIDDNTFAIINDNDFGLNSSFIFNTIPQRDPKKQSFLIFFQLNK